MTTELLFTPRRYPSFLVSLPVASGQVAMIAATAVFLVLSPMAITFSVGAPGPPCTIGGRKPVMSQTFRWSWFAVTWSFASGLTGMTICVCAFTWNPVPGYQVSSCGWGMIRGGTITSK